MPALHVFKLLLPYLTAVLTLAKFPNNRNIAKYIPSQTVILLMKTLIKQDLLVSLNTFENSTQKLLQTDLILHLHNILFSLFLTILLFQATVHLFLFIFLTILLKMHLVITKIFGFCLRT